MKTLVLGYGNADREDDGVAWHVIRSLISSLGGEAPTEMEEENPLSIGGIDFLFLLQLTPELSELISGYDRICFVDAHTGAVPESVHFEVLDPGYQHSPFTHHLTPNSLLAMTGSIYHQIPHAILVSVRGFEFGFSRELSAAAADLIPHAVELILNWLNHHTPSSLGG